MISRDPEAPQGQRSLPQLSELEPLALKVQATPHKLQTRTDSPTRGGIRARRLKPQQARAGRQAEGCLGPH